MRIRFASLTSFAVALPLLAGGCTTKVSTNPPAPAPAPEPEPEPEPVAEAPKEYPAPPAAGTPKPVNFPPIADFQLDNGLMVYLVENHEVPLVTVQLVVRAGSMDEAVVADLTATMLGEGTKARSKAKIDEAIEYVGGSLSQGAGTHATYVSVRTLKKDLKLGLTLLADQVVNPLFPADALEKQKAQVKASLSMAASQPTSLASQLFDNLAYPDGHPYGRMLATPEQVDAVTVDDLEAFHETFFRANNSFVVVAGDITPEDAKPLIERTLGKWKYTSGRKLPANPLNAFKSYDLPSELIVHIVDRPGSAQAEIMLGNLSLARNHKDWAALSVANSILGGSASGRLFQDIREEKGLAYNVSSALSDGQAPGTFYITTRTRTNTTGEMLAGLFGHLKTIRTEAPSAEEVSSATARIVGQFPLELETPNQIAAKVREGLIYALPSNYWRDYRDVIGAVTPEQVLEVAKKYMHPIPHVVIVGEAKDIQSQVSTVLPKATVKVYGADLKPKG